MVLAVVTVIFLFCSLHGIGFFIVSYLMKKVEQYDEHIALYIDNTFVRTKYRILYYRYEENWLLIRMLSDDELKESIQKYGDPDDYYNCWQNQSDEMKLYKNQTRVNDILF